MDAKKRVVVIGGGAAGMMASLTAAEQGCHVILFEKNVRLGRKMLISGKGRCNITNDCTVPQLVKSMVGNGKFLYSAFSNFSAEDTMAWFNDGGVPLKTERGQRVFPASDRSADIVSFIERKLRKAGVDVHFHAEVKEICQENCAVTGVKAEGKFIPADAVIVATGGVSYPLTGSTGDGYAMAEAMGHKVNPRFPSLVPLVVKEDWVRDLEGLSLRNAEVTVSIRNGKVLGREFGEMVFTDFGLSGPVILTLSRLCGAYFLADPQEPLSLSINLKPALSEEQLDERLLRDFDTYSKRSYRTILEGLLPKKLIPIFVVQSGIDPWKQGHQLNREDRKIIRKLLRDLSFTVVGCRPIEEAIVTAGGVSVKEIDPKTMASKKTKGLFFAGEVIDIDGLTGGFNLQAALSTGKQSGIGAALICQSGE